MAGISEPCQDAIGSVFRCYEAAPRIVGAGGEGIVARSENSAGPHPRHTQVIDRQHFDPFLFRDFFLSILALLRIVLGRNNGQALDGECGVHRLPQAMGNYLNPKRFPFPGLEGDPIAIPPREKTSNDFTGKFHGLGLAGIVIGLGFQNDLFARL